MPSILQPWVEGLGLRHQGVLLTAVRGCDVAPKDDPSKLFTRCYRAVILVPHCGDPMKAQTFIQSVCDEELNSRFQIFRKNLDHYPHHYIGHVLHSVEIIGYKHPDSGVAATWLKFYKILCRGFHVNPETEQQLDDRLNADEDIFGKRDKE